jgi:uncharacterized protein
LERNVCIGLFLQLTYKFILIKQLQTDRDCIAAYALSNEQENDAFRVFIKHSDGEKIDALVQHLNQIIEPLIDCTACGACCKTLMINVKKEEAEKLSARLDISLAAFKEAYIEESQQGQLIINQMPCHFLEGTRCSVYENRFTECREFPHLGRENFKDRLFGTLVHYAMCPIIFNVVEALKIETGFKELA